MGYSHYWKKEKRITQKDYDKVLEQCKTIVKVISSAKCELINDKILAGGMGKGKPEYKTDINFNGIGSLSHENFYLPERINDIDDFQFCKTATKPYDVVVTACLVCLGSLEGIVVSSDGSPSDWVEGVNLASNILGKQLKLPKHVQEAI